MEKVGQYRNIKMILRKPLLDEYIDDAENFVFEEIYLEEAKALTTEKEKTDITEELQKAVKNLKIEGNPRKTRWNEIEKSFAIEKFSGKQKAAYWLETFEEECSRHEITEDEQKIKCLRLFVTEKAQDWYQANAVKLERDDWGAWSASLVRVFSDKGWAKVRHALSYKYIAGSILEYALRKERLLLEIEKESTELTRINQVVVGLPVFIQDRLDREKIGSSDGLMNELRQYESSVKKGSQRTEKGPRLLESPRLETSVRRNYNYGTEGTVEKKPCPICESKGYPGRYHPMERCRNKDRRENLRINLNEDSECELLEQREEKN